MSEFKNRLWGDVVLIPEMEWTDPPLPDATWRPPPPERFWQLDATDEFWARPLGIGTLVTFQQISDEIKERIEKKIIEMFAVPYSLSLPDWKANQTTGRR